MIMWQWSLFDKLSRDELFEILKVRQAVFIIEQNCVYSDIDELDRDSWHLMGWRKDFGEKALVAYLRVTIPGKKYSEPSIGRLLTIPSVRGKGIGKLLTEQAINRIEIEYPNANIRISAQQYLEKFYSEFGFENVSDAYDEDGIPHIEMLKRWYRANVDLPDEPGRYGRNNVVGSSTSVVDRIVNTTKSINYVRLNELNPNDFIPLLNSQKVRKHLIEHELFTIDTV